MHTNKYTLILIILTSLIFTFGCSNKNSEENVQTKEDNQGNEQQIVEEQEEEQVNPLYDTENLVQSNMKIFLNDNPLDLNNTIAKKPLKNNKGNILLPFISSYKLLGFEIELNETEEDLSITAINNSTKIYVAINKYSNIKSISINDKDLSGENIQMYLLEDQNKKNSELLIPLEFIAKSLDTTIVEGNEKDSLVLNTNDFKEKQEKIIEEDNLEDIFSGIGIGIGDSLDKAKEKFGEIGDTGGYQGSDYYSFNNITIFTEIGTKVITSIGLPNSTYSIDGIKAGDNIKKVYDKYGKKEPVEYEGITSVIYENIKGYKVEYSLKSNKKTISFITISEKTSRE